MPPKSVFVLDTSALLALRSDESGADRVETVIQQAKKNQVRLLVSFMTRMEVLYRVWREDGHEAARLIDSFPIEWVSCGPEILEMAARLKAQGKLSVADSWIGATAIIREATLIHKDPEFRNFKEIPQEFLGKRA